MAELDRGFASYAAKVKRRTGLKDRHVAEGWMRGQGGPALMRPDDLPRIAGLTDVFLRLEGATLSIALDPADLDAMVADWQAEVDAHPGTDPRAFTRRFLYEGMLLNRHRDASTDLMLAALWLTATGPTGDAARELLKRGDCGFFTDITVEDDGRTYRVRSWVEDYGAERAG